MSQVVLGLSRQPASQRHPQLPLTGPGSHFTHPRMLVTGEVPVLWLALSLQQREEGKDAAAPELLPVTGGNPLPPWL